MKRRRVTVGRLKRFFHAPKRWLQQVFEQSCLEERLGAEGAEVSLPLPINNTLNAPAIVKEDWKQQASIAGEARRPSAEPILAWLGKAAILATIGVKQVELSNRTVSDTSEAKHQEFLSAAFRAGRDNRFQLVISSHLGLTESRVGKSTGHDVKAARRAV